MITPINFHVLDVVQSVRFAYDGYWEYKNGKDSYNTLLTGLNALFVLNRVASAIFLFNHDQQNKVDLAAMGIIALKVFLELGDPRENIAKRSCPERINQIAETAIDLIVRCAYPKLNPKTPEQTYFLYAFAILPMFIRPMLYCKSWIEKKIPVNTQVAVDKIGNSPQPAATLFETIDAVRQQTQNAVHKIGNSPQPAATLFGTIDAVRQEACQNLFLREVIKCEDLLTECKKILLSICAANPNPLSEDSEASPIISGRPSSDEMTGSPPLTNQALTRTVSPASGASSPNRQTPPAKKTGAAVSRNAASPAGGASSPSTRTSSAKKTGAAVSRNAVGSAHETHSLDTQTPPLKKALNDALDSITGYLADYQHKMVISWVKLFTDLISLLHGLISYIRKTEKQINNIDRLVRKVEQKVLSINERYNFSGGSDIRAIISTLSTLRDEISQINISILRNCKTDLKLQHEAITHIMHLDDSQKVSQYTSDLFKSVRGTIIRTEKAPNDDEAQKLSTTPTAPLKSAQDTPDKKPIFDEIEKMDRFLKRMAREILQQYLILEQKLHALELQTPTYKPPGKFPKPVSEDLDSFR